MRRITQIKSFSPQMMPIKLCPHISLGVYMEVLGQRNASHIQVTDSLCGDSVNGDRTASTMIDGDFKSTHFVTKTKSGDLGTHIVRKHQ
jgi:hypothetical protein